MGNAYSELEDQIVWCGTKPNVSAQNKTIQTRTRERKKEDIKRGYSVVFPMERPRRAWEQPPILPSPESSVKAFPDLPETPQQSVRSARLEVPEDILLSIRSKKPFQLPRSANDPANMLPPKFDPRPAPMVPESRATRPEQVIHYEPPPQHPYPRDYVATMEEKVRFVPSTDERVRFAAAVEERIPSAPSAPSTQRSTLPPLPTFSTPAIKPGAEILLPDTPSSAQSQSQDGERRIGPVWDRKAQLTETQKREVASLVVTTSSPEEAALLETPTEYWVQVGNSPSALVDLTPVLRQRLEDKVSDRLAEQLLELSRGDVDKAEQFGRWAVGYSMALAKVASSTRRGSVTPQAFSALEECAYNADDAVAMLRTGSS